MEYCLGFENWNSCLKDKKLVMRTSEAREPPAGTIFKAGRRPAAEASYNNVLDCRMIFVNWKRQSLYFRFFSDEGNLNETWEHGEHAHGTCNPKMTIKLPS